MEHKLLGLVEVVWGMALGKPAGGGTKAHRSGPAWSVRAPWSPAGGRSAARRSRPRACPEPEQLLQRMVFFVKPVPARRPSRRTLSITEQYPARRQLLAWQFAVSN